MLEDVKSKILEIKDMLDPIDAYTYLFDGSLDKSKRDAAASISTLKQNLNRLLFLVDAMEITDLEFPDVDPVRKRLGTGLVKVKPCGAEFGGRTFVGFYIGDVPLSVSARIVEDGKKIAIEPSLHNPCIYIPELDKVVFGINSWWGKIESPEDLSDITNDDISKTWYVRLLSENFGEDTDE